MKIMADPRNTFKDACVCCMADNRLPNFFIIGAAKAGTTSLYEYLRQHPDIYLSYAKEPQFFSNDDLYAKGQEFYLNTFFDRSAGYSIRGEATPHYLYYEKVARRIKAGLPEGDQKFLVILRNPIERAYSLYWNMVYEGHETLTFPEAIRCESMREGKAELERDGRVRFQYADSGMYAKQLRRYFKYFDRSNFHIIFQEDLKRDAQEVLDSVCKFLGISNWQLKERPRKFNESGQARSTMLQRFLRQPNALKRGLGRLFPYRVKYHIVSRLLKWNKRSFAYPLMDESIHQELRVTFRKDVEELASITGRDLSHWLQ